MAGVLNSLGAMGRSSAISEQCSSKAKSGGPSHEKLAAAQI